MNDLLIFDCDGVLIDSEPISVAVIVDVLGGEGLPVDEDLVYQRFLGRSMSAMREVLRSDFDYVLDDALMATIREQMRGRFRAELKPVPGIAEALTRLPGRHCVASSSSPERLNLTLGLTGLLQYFQPHVFSATMVKNGKPAPDLFLYAAGQMGFAPRDCIVVEDSPAGVEAAKRAGMRVFAFTGGGHAARCNLASSLAALNPDVMFDNMLRLPGLLAEDARAN